MDSSAQEICDTPALQRMQMAVHMKVWICSLACRPQVIAYMMQVGLDVRGKHDLEESLDFYVQSELMEGENQYLCEEAGRKVPYCVCPFAAALALASQTSRDG